MSLFLRKLDTRGMRSHARTQMTKLGISTIQDMAVRVESLCGGQRQAVAVARAAAFGSKVIILDEPTAALGVRESNQVLEMIKELRRHGMPIILISHNMPVVFEVADRIHIQRLGRCAGIVTPRTHDGGGLGDHDRRERARAEQLNRPRAPTAPISARIPMGQLSSRGGADLGPASKAWSTRPREHALQFARGGTRAMRGHEQHVERKIRLWVVQQERNRLRETQSERREAPIDESADPGRPDVDARSHEHWRLG